MAKKAIRLIRIEGNVAYVPLTKGYEAVIDAADVPLVEGRSWFSIVNRHTVYAGTMGARPDRYVERMHRLIMNAHPQHEIDHKDGNGLNNRRENLRVATSSENKFNRRFSTTSKSGLPGVSSQSGTKKWRAAINLRRHKIHLGYFDTPEMAHEAYLKAKRDLHGEFGNVSR